LSTGVEEAIAIDGQGAVQASQAESNFTRFTILLLKFQLLCILRLQQ
jgi:hypothetical protein